MRTVTTVIGKLREKHFWKVQLVLLHLLWLMIAIFAYYAFGANRTVSLSIEQETALLAATELANERRGCTMISCGGKLATDGTPLVPLTVDQALAQIIAAEMTNGLRNLDATIAPVLENLKALDAATLTKVLATVASQATKDRVQQKLGP